MKELAIETLRLINFLDCNQLVQANAIACKMESMLEDVIGKDIGSNRRRGASESPRSHRSEGMTKNEPKGMKDPSSDMSHKPQSESPESSNEPKNSEEPNEPRLESHPRWRDFRAVHRIKQYILSGTTAKALAEARGVLESLQGS